MEITGTLYADAKTAYEVTYTPDIVYAHRETGDLTLQVLTPAHPNWPQPHKPSIFDKLIEEGLIQPGPAPEPEKRRFPLIVDVPGSGWSGAEGYYHVPKMVELARQGYVVASIAYRGTFKDDVRFPAAVQDTLEALRFMRAHADDFLVDIDRVALLGDSSGGHTVALAALAGDDPRFNIGENLSERTDVKSCVIFYGPNDLTNLVADRIAEGKVLRPGEGEYPFESREIFQNDYLKDPQGMLADASPINYISADKKMPPFIFLNGDEDPIIPLHQGDRFCRKVRECGGRAEFYKIIGGGHGTGCWTNEAMSLILQHLNATV